MARTPYHLVKHSLNAFLPPQITAALPCGHPPLGAQFLRLDSDSIRAWMPPVVNHHQPRFRHCMTDAQQIFPDKIRISRIHKQMNVNLQLLIHNKNPFTFSLFIESPTSCAVRRKKTIPFPGPCLLLAENQ